MSEIRSPEKYIMRLNGFGNPSQGTVIRKVDNEDKEFGPYIVIFASEVSGRAGDSEFVKSVYGLEIDMQSDEPRILDEKIILNPNDRVNVVGTYAINPADPNWPHLAQEIREHLGLDGDFSDLE